MLECLNRTLSLLSEDSLYLLSHSRSSEAEITASCLCKSPRCHLNDSVSVLSLKCSVLVVQHSNANTKHIQYYLDYTRKWQESESSKTVSLLVPAAGWQRSRAAVIGGMVELCSGGAVQLECPRATQRVPTRPELTKRSDLSRCERTKWEVSINHHIKSASNLHICLTFLEATLNMWDATTAVSHANMRRSWRWKVVGGSVVLEMCFGAALETLSRPSPPPDVCWYRFRLFCSVSRHLGWPLIDSALLSESSAGWCDSRSQPLNWSKRPFVT